MDSPSGEFSDQWVAWRSRVDLDRYDAKWERLESQGASIHGEADFVTRWLKRLANETKESPNGQLVMDAGCGSGRVGMELARRGYTVVGVDNDPDMLALARPKSANHVELNQRVRWELGNLSVVRFTERFDTIALAGDVLVYAKAQDRRQAVVNLAEHLKPSGLLIAGSSFAPGYDLATHCQWCVDAGLEVLGQFATWDEYPYAGGTYGISVAQKRRTG